LSFIWTAFQEEPSVYDWLTWQVLATHLAAATHFEQSNLTNVEDLDGSK
jgi:hypothetical protein